MTTEAVGGDRSPGAADLVARIRASGSLGSPLLGLPGVGPRTAERLAAHGLHTRADLLELVPRRWDDLRRITPLHALVPDRVQATLGRVLSARFLFGRRRSLEVRFAADPGDDPPAPAATQLVARWFHARSGMKDRFAAGARFLLTGVVRQHRGQAMMVHPQADLLDADLEPDASGPGVRAVYPAVEGVPAKLLSSLARLLARAHAGEVVDGVPPALLATHGFPARGQALACLHAADDDGAGQSPAAAAETMAALAAGRHPAQQRLAWEELFFLQLGLAARRASVARAPGLACPMAAASVDRFLAALPFAPTAAQRRALAEIGADLARPHPMHRLLQGDVGAGKTVVMYGAAEQTMAAGCQVAVMAPTELLAEQHARTLAPWARATGRRLALLTASTARADRQAVHRGLLASSDQRLDLVVGTHALLGEEVRFARLGLVIVDEQHRFGVGQRAALRDKVAAAVPHLLVTTATPIPRTLALTVFGDLDVTVIDEVPPGRSPAETRLALGARGRQQAYRTLVRAVLDGRQAFVVCPRVGGDQRAPDDDPRLPPAGDEGEDPDVGSAIATHLRLARLLPGLPVGLVHGRLAAGDRDAVMRAFAEGSLRVLVATTVIEVGVDVPDAEVMLVDGAERFGLAQLHQLRGRIGRTARPPLSPPPLCLLASTAAAASEAALRLDVLVRQSDGLAIAEADLALRGPGEILGTRQAGVLGLRFADLGRDLGLLAAARHDAFALMASDPDLARSEHATTRAVLDQLRRRHHAAG